MSKAFGGNRAHNAAALGIQAPVDVVYSSNITPAHVTGIGGWTAADIVRAMKDGIDKNGAPRCQPMPFGPMGGYGRLSDEDALDIATYILGLPEIDKFTEGSCLIQ